MRRVILGLTAALLATGPAASWDASQSMTEANALGSVLASEDICGLSFDQNRVAAYIEKTVPADDMQFAGSLAMMTSGNAVQINEMTPSSKTAHCTQIKRVAKSYGFTE